MKVKKGKYKRKDMEQRPHWMAVYLKIGLPILAVLALVAIILDIQDVGKKILSGESEKEREHDDHVDNACCQHKENGV